MSSQTLAVIPARRGSRGLKGKHLLPIGGVPAIMRTVDAARQAGLGVIVATDDPEIEACLPDVMIHQREPVDAFQPVDDAVREATMGWDGPVMLLQATVQPVTGDILAAFLEDVTEPTTMTIPVEHQLFVDGKRVTEFVNRQQLSTYPQQEVGIRWWPHRDMIGDVLTPKPVKTRLYDIDTPADYQACQPAKRIHIWPAASHQTGTGHIRRQLLIAQRLQHHDVTFIVNDCDTATVNLLLDKGWTANQYRESMNPDLWILDRLNNTDMPVLAPVVVFEDTSGYPATATINALYGQVPYGEPADWAIVRPEFTTRPWKRDMTGTDVTSVMVMFGGTDPRGLGTTVSGWLKNAGYKVDHIPPYADVPVANHMRQADVLVTSAGRTVYEAQTLGIPTVVVAQNVKETTHKHLDGCMYLGMNPTAEQLIDAVENVKYHTKRKPDGRGLARTVHLIEGILDHGNVVCDTRIPI